MSTRSSIHAWRIPMDRGAWWTTVHRVTMSQTRLKQISTQTYMSICVYGYVVCVYLWICACECLCVFAYMFVSVCIYRCLYIYIGVCMYVYVYLYVCEYLCIWVCCVCVFMDMCL